MVLFLRRDGPMSLRGFQRPRCRGDGCIKIVAHIRQTVGRMERLVGPGKSGIAERELAPFGRVDPDKVENRGKEIKMDHVLTKLSGERPSTRRDCRKCDVPEPVQAWLMTGLLFHCQVVAQNNDIDVLQVSFLTDVSHKIGHLIGGTFDKVLKIPHPMLRTVL